MTHAEMEAMLREIFPQVKDEPIAEAMRAVGEFAESEVERAKEYFECDGECEYVQHACEDPLTNEVRNDLEEVIRTFDSDPQTAKYLLSRALKDIPGAPQWLD